VDVDGVFDAAGITARHSDRDWNVRGTAQLEDHAVAGRQTGLGEVEPAAVPDVLYGGGIYVWPGYGEAYGVAYLEAQAAGLPVVAQHIAGVPEVVRAGQTGFLTPPGDVAAFAAAIARLLADNDERTTMAAQARRFVLEERSLGGAAARLAELLEKIPVP